jgi:cell division protein ZapA
MNDKIKINLNIADSLYPITVDRDKEELMRRAAKRVNDRLNAYRGRFVGQTMDRLLAMVAYHFAQDLEENEQRNDTAPYNAKIEELTELLDEHFKGE